MNPIVASKVSFDPSIVKVKLQASKKTRSTLGPNNAERWKQTFDEMIKDRQNRKVNALILGKTIGTLYVAANDALAFLVMTDPAKYEAFRNDISIRKEEDGIVIFFKQNLPSIVSNAVSETQRSSPTVLVQPRNWKEELEKALEKVPEGTIIAATFNMSEDDQKFIFEICSRYPDCECETTSTSYKICK